jgi:hypothetical protein
MVALSGKVFADAEGNAQEDFFNLSAGVINEGSSVTASLQFSAQPANETGNAGTTTRRMNGNTLSLSAPGSTSGGAPISLPNQAPNGGPSGGSAVFTYNQEGTYTISYGQNLSWHWQENASYSTGNPSGDASTFLSDSRVLTVLNVAPQNVTLSLASSVINQGSNGGASMTATDPGADTLTFNVNGNLVTDPNNTPGATRSSGTVNLGTYNVPGTYTITGSVNDGTATSFASNQILTVLNLPPIIDSLVIFSRVPVINGASDMISFQVTAHDPGGDALTVAWNLSGGGGPYNDQIGNNPTVPVQYFIGVHTISVQVSDPYGGVVTQDLTFTVIPEPASLLLIGLGGALAIPLFRRRRR